MKREALSRQVWRCALVFLILAGVTWTRPDDPVPVPKEPIIMWSGLLSEIPKGWQLCDGTNRTPDLRDRFVQGIYDGNEIGETGGSHLMHLTVDNLPSHVHNIVTDGDGAHVHEYDDKYGVGSVYEPYGVTYYNSPGEGWPSVDRYSALAGAHNHSGETFERGYGIPFENRPPYYRLAFITRPCVNKKTWSPGSPAALGCIVIWSDNGAPLPGGWEICNGANGTPDLRNRFVLSVKAGQDPGDLGGTETAYLTVDNLPSHSHPFETDTGGDHGHWFNDILSGPLTNISYGGLILGYDILVEDEDIGQRDTTSAGKHSHSGFTSYEGQSQTIDNRPAYSRMPFIMMTSTKKSRAAVIPEGAIAIWSESVSEIPHGWQLCDGTNGTPDLRDRFVVGGEVQGESGGANQILLTTQTMPVHYHSLVTGGTGEHKHTVNDHWHMTSYVWIWGWEPTRKIAAPPYTEIQRTTESDGVHNHSGVTDPFGGSMPYDNRPAYYKAAYIMRMF